MPGYKPKGGRTTVHFPLAQLNGKGTLASLEGKDLYTDYAKRKALSPEARAAHASLRISDVIAGLAAHMPEGSSALEVRIAPKSKGRVKLEVVFKVPFQAKPGTVMTKFYEELPENTPAGKINGLALAFLKAFPGALRLAAIDLGVNNLATMGFSTGRKGIIVSHKELELKIGRLDALIDAAKSSLVPDEVKALQKRKADGDTLTKDDLHTIGHGMASVFQDAKLLELMELRTNTLDTYLHRISRKLVDKIVSAGVDVLVVGLNKQWKTESAMGKTQNRRFHNIAHTRLIELLRYKAAERGILLVTTEESYTSKTSFALNEPLSSKVKGSEPRTNALAGKRGGVKRREFTSPAGDARWTKIHADLNGAFNIMRKAFPGFRWSNRLSPNYTIYWASPSKGLAPYRSSCIMRSS